VHVGDRADGAGASATGAEAIRLLTGLVRNVADHPQPGIVFKDITPLLGHPDAYATAIAALAAPFQGRVDQVAAIEARGFILGAPVAYALGTGLVPMRKVGKLPAATASAPYALEYGEAVLEMHVDALRPEERVLVVDDVIATGGTARAAIRLVEGVGARVVGITALLEIAGLGGRAGLDGYDVRVVLPPTPD
jgi:adenine phosphoribosyltransferase